MQAQFPADCAARFKPDKLLGSGGYGQVWLAHQLDLDRPVVVKLLHAETAAQPEAVQRFLAEAQITALLRHPHIVVVLDHGCREGLPWIVYEYVRGESLRSKLDRGRLPWAEVVQLGIQVAGALEAAHARGILHRDIKPDNVLEAGPGDYKVTDFGIAKWSGNQAKTEHGMILGTPAYLSPQQLRGLAPAFESDIYALGVMLYEACAGKLPWWDENLALLLQRRLTIPAPPLSETVPDIPAELERIILRMISPDREQRLPPIEEIRHALERVAGERPSHRTRALKPVTRPDGTGRGTGRVAVPSKPSVVVPPAPSRAPVLGAALAIFLGGGLLVWSLMPGRSPRPDGSPSPSVAASSGSAPGSSASASAGPAPSASPAPFGGEVLAEMIRLDDVWRPVSSERSGLGQTYRDALRRSASEGLRMVRELVGKRDQTAAWLDLLWLLDDVVLKAFSGPPAACPEVTAVLRILASELDRVPDGTFPGVFRSMMRPRIESVLAYTGDRNTTVLAKATDAAVDTLETSAGNAWKSSYEGLAHRMFVADDAAWCARRTNRLWMSKKAPAVLQRADAVAALARTVLDKLRREPAALESDPEAAFTLLATLHGITGIWDGGHQNRPEDTRAVSEQLLALPPSPRWPKDFAAEIHLRKETLRDRMSRRK